MDKQIKKPDKSLGKSVVVKKGKITYLIGKPSFVLVKEEKKQ